MVRLMPFGDVLEAADQLTAEEQETLAKTLLRHVAEHGRKRIGADIREAREEFAAGGCQPTTPDELLHEIRS